MFDRDTISLKRKAYRFFHLIFLSIYLMDFAKKLLQVTLYVAGFPCTPFSVLHGNSMLLQDHEARQMYETVERLIEVSPNSTFSHWLQSQAGILENVLGIRRVMDEIMTLLVESLPEKLSY